MPRTVQVAVAQRTERQNDAAKRVLAIASVIGQRFDVGLLQTLTAMSELQLLIDKTVTTRLKTCQVSET